MRVLVACEESQVVCKAFRDKGHEAFSCDILDCSGGHPEWHIKDDVRNVLNSYPILMGFKWDMIIGFPPCTHLANSGAKHFAKKKKDGRQQEGIDLFMAIANADCPKIAIENPVGIMSTVWRKPDQIIHPYMFGDYVQKKTCLWLKGLPKLISTDVRFKDPQTKFFANKVKFSSGKTMSDWYYQTSCLPHNQRSLARSKTFPGIAKAMAEQWA